MNGSIVSARTSRHEIRLEGDFQSFTAELTSETLGEGLDRVILRLRADQPVRPGPMRLAFRHPSVNVFARWHPAVLHARHLPPDWGDGFTAELTRNAPVMCLYAADGTNQLTVACSDPMNPLMLRFGVQEESAEVRCRVHLFERVHPPITRYELQLLVDTRPVFYAAALDHVQSWWATRPGCQPRSVPEVARLPMYSTWYSFHQNIDTAAVLAQCRLARELGCDALIVDDGWQTNDNRRGYAYAGDWEAQRIGDMKRFVADVHDVGMKFLLWYAVPFVGIHSRAFRRFEDKLLTRLESLQAGVLDPRFPDVREHLIGTLERALRDWDLDGFKLDFVDEFAVRNGVRAPEPRPGMDFVSVSEAAYRLLEDTFDRLHQIKPDIMVEFRQEYIGPVMRRFGNMFRAGDCPNDALTNRLRTLDIRLLCGRTACHSDMLMWHPDDRVEAAALQVLATLFSVPQVSVLLDRLAPAHLKMLRFWLDFWRANRDVLLDGELRPLHPETLYPVVVASTPHKRLIALYQEMVAPAGSNVPRELLVVNATFASRAVIDIPEAIGKRTLEIRDCQGNVVASERRAFTAGVHVLSVPPAGLVRIGA